MSSSTNPFPRFGSNLCGHNDSQGRRLFRVDCPTCTPMQYRCIWCYQPAVERKMVPTECRAGFSHVTNGRDSLCALCGGLAFREKTGDKTTCEILPEHELAVYPFKCEACKGSVSLERLTYCEASYDGRHLLKSGFMSVVAPKFNRNDRTNIYREEVEEDYSAQIDSLLNMLRHKRTTRRFVSQRVNKKGGR